MKRYLLFIIIFLISVSLVKSQLAANFNVNQQSGCSPLAVDFTNDTNPLIGTTFLWDFGNGNTSTAINPTATYVTAGTYTVKLTATNGSLIDTQIKTAYITVYSKPTADFNISQSAYGCVPFDVNFVNSSSGAGQLNYVWSFGDGGQSTASNPFHTYTNNGIFEVTVYVTDQFGCTNSKTISEFIHSQKPSAKFGVDKTTSCIGTLSSVFTNNSEGLAPAAFNWDFGDGTQTTDISPSHTFTQPGNYTVKLIITDNIGCKDSVYPTNLIQIVKTTAKFLVLKDTLCSGQKFTLTNESAASNSYKWTFADGTFSTLTHPEKTYQNASDYLIWLKATNGICTDSVSKLINVELIKAKFASADSFACQVPSNVTYQNLSENAVSYDWRFGNGSASTLQTPTVVFEATTELNTNFNVFYTDTLTATSKHGCKHTFIKPKSVNIHIPKVVIGTNKTPSGCVPFDVIFTNQSTYITPLDSIVTRKWEIGTNPPVFVNQTTASFTTTGKIQAKLIVTTARGCAAELITTVNSGEKITPNFSMTNEYNNCAQIPVVLQNTTAELEKVTSTVWDMGDNTVYPFDNPSHFYEKTGTYNVSLTAYNYGCASKITKTNFINILGPVVSFKNTAECIAPLDYAFTATISEATSYFWDFGDGSPTVSNIPNPTHSFAAKGDYEVVLSANNSSTGCSFIYHGGANVRKINANFDFDDTKQCPNTPLIFDATSSVDNWPFVVNGEVKNFLWSFSDLSNPIFTDSPVNHTFKTRGNYQISLVVQDRNGCKDTLHKSLKTYLPTPEFAGNYKLGCMPITFEFNNSSVTDTTIASWEWNFGDTNTSAIESPEHIYTSFGQYNVSLKATNILGCSSTITKNQLIQAIFPDARFKANDTTLCIGQDINFTDISSSIITDYEWDLGDGITSTISKPSRSYPSTGSYPVTLKIKDIHGCEATLSKPNYILVQKPPIPDFKADNTSSNCYPFLVQFQDKSQTPNPGSYVWYFGDKDNKSLIKNPFFIYAKPGNYTVTLISSSSFGCADTLIRSKYINVGGPYAEFNMKDTACFNVPTSFEAINQVNINAIRWDFGDGYSANGDQTAHIYQTRGIKHPVMLIQSDESNTCNKAIIDTLVIQQITSAYSFKDNKTQGCVPLDITLINNSINAESYKWIFGDGTESNLENPDHTYVSSGNFENQLVASNHVGCIDTLKSRFVKVFALPLVKTSNDTIICLGTSAQLLAIGANNYIWTPALSLSNSNLSITFATPQTSTLYTVWGTDLNNCSQKDSTFVSVQQIPVVNLTDTSIIIGETYYLDISDDGIQTFQWTPNNDLTCSNCPSLGFKPLQTTKYTVAVSDTSNCFNESYPITISVIEKYSVDVPTAFTPNNDGINDIIKVNGWGIKELIDFKIFNRFGQMVYQSNDIMQGWDGNYKNKPQPSETYQYVVQILTYGGVIISKQGTIKLLK